MRDLIMATITIALVGYGIYLVGFPTTLLVATIGTVGGLLTHWFINRKENE